MDVTIGSARFCAEGPEASVRQDYERFLGAVLSPRRSVERPGEAAINELLQTISPVPRSVSSQLDPIFSLHPDSIVSLKRVPSGANAQGATCLGLLYGFDEILQRPLVSAKDVMKGAERSGIRMDRIDRPLGEYLSTGQVTKIGVKRGSHYGLTPNGKRAAESLIDQLKGGSGKNEGGR